MFDWHFEGAQLEVEWRIGALLQLQLTAGHFILLEKYTLNLFEVAGM